MPILLPKQALHTHVGYYSHMFFLAGPIRGGGDWQARMYLLLQQRAAGALVVCPCRWESNHPLAGEFLADTAPTQFKRQLAWERHFLAIAGTSNATRTCIVFYLPTESEVAPHPGPEPYAMDTRGELGEWRMRMKYEGARVVVGAEVGFYGLSQIQRSFTDVLGYDFPIHKSMEATADAAVAVSGRP